MQVAGLTDPTTNISPSAAEDAAYQLKDRINSLENEIEDLKLKVICAKTLKILS